MLRLDVVELAIESISSSLESESYTLCIGTVGIVTDWTLGSDEDRGFDLIVVFIRREVLGFLPVGLSGLLNPSVDVSFASGLIIVLAEAELIS